MIAASELPIDISAAASQMAEMLSQCRQIGFAAGLATESFLPGSQLRHSFEPGRVDEIHALISEIDPDTGGGSGPAARWMLKRCEAALLLQAPPAAHAA